MMHKLLWGILFIFINFAADAQNVKAVKIAKKYIETELPTSELTPGDIADLHLQDAYTDSNTGATYLYFIQRYNGIEIYNALFNIVLDGNDEVVHAGNRLVFGLEDKIISGSEYISPQSAVLSAAEELGIVSASSKSSLTLEKKISDESFLFQENGISQSKIPAKLCYQKLPSGKLQLAWNLSLDVIGTDDHWSIRADAFSGKILDKNNYTVYCSFEKEPVGLSNQAEVGYHTDCSEHFQMSNFDENQKINESALTTQISGSYRVFELPIESPNHGSQTLISEPHDITASPFGWHDTDGVTGADYTITRGNNAHAYLDVFNRNESRGDEPDGGVDLIFDYEYDASREPDEQPEAAVTNLFYMTNMMHDFSYRYGFTEEAGNFQGNNYDRGGSGDDYVEAQAQDGGDENNANFSTPADGGNGRMQMYLWSGGELLNVEEPAEIAGWYHTGSAQYGPRVDASTNISGELVLAQDSVFNASGTDGCEPFKNADLVAGKIAVVDRGGCFFKEKSLNAEAAGALALIMCNFNETAADLGGTNQVPGTPTIPTISLGNGDCQLLKNYLSEGVKVSIKQRNGGVQYTDSDFDNGIIAHEYAHGISNRLTAGRFNTGCLSNVEQAGEGWSDFFSLAVTAVEADRNRARGVGTYARKEGTDGRGLRPFLYSDDMNVNPATYADVAQFSVPHGVGFVWASMLNDLYWAMSDAYSFDDDLLTGTGGNNMAIRLVMEGLKLQPCRPGFEDARDAVLAADRMLYNGDNQCLIWEVFARRGLGFYADQGSNNIVGDETLSFESMPSCIQTLKISKTAEPLADAGDDISIELKILNHKATAVANTVITDELPEGLTYSEIEDVTGITQSDISVKTNVAGFVSFEILKDLAPDDEVSIVYKVATDPAKYSVRMYYDEVPDDSNDTWNRWLPAIEAGGDNNDVDNIWRLTDGGGVTDDWAWSVEDHKLETRQALYSAESFRISGQQPVIRFYHKYDTYPGQHGGVFEISDDARISYKNQADLFFRNGYPGLISYESFVIPDFYAFSGRARNYEASYLDMSDFVGQELYFRFRLGTRDVTEFEGDSFLDYFLSDNGGSGWQFDNFEIMDMFNYDGEACVTSSDGDRACAKSPGRGTIIESKISTNTLDLGNESGVAIYPNPASETIHLAFQTDKRQAFDVQIFDLSGKPLHRQVLKIGSGEHVSSININFLTTGVYFVNIKSNEAVITEKIIVR